MKHALEELMEGPCYHMWEICGPENIKLRTHHVNFWNHALDGKKSGKDIYDFLTEENHYVSGCDLPIGCFWKEIFEAKNKNIKVILTLRKDPASWWTSVNYTINNVYNRLGHVPPSSWVLRWMDIKRNLDMAERAKDRIGVGLNVNNDIYYRLISKLLTFLECEK